MSPNSREIDAPNPFCTRRVRPGAVDYIFAEGESAARLVERLRANRWRGEITGPHGSGKSALLAALISEIRSAGKTPVLVELRDRQRRLPINLNQLLTRNDGSGATAGLSSSAGNTAGQASSGAHRNDCYKVLGIGSDTSGKPLIIIDGYEQLGLWSRFVLMLFRRRHGIGLLVTSHRPTGLPELYRTRPTAELAAEIVARLLADRPHEEVTFTSVESAFKRHGGDIREVLFDFYDLWEKRRREES